SCRTLSVTPPSAWPNTLWNASSTFLFNHRLTTLVMGPLSFAGLKVDFQSPDSCPHLERGGAALDHHDHDDARPHPARAIAATSKISSTRSYSCSKTSLGSKEGRSPSWVTQ